MRTLLRRSLALDTAEAAGFVSEQVLRVRDLYLAGSAHAFEDGVLGVHQVLAGTLDARSGSGAAPTRERVR